MGVTTTLINKPFNPRAQDQSPKGYNRAALYSGKALDFDGVNDNIAFTDFQFTAGNKYSLCIYANRDVNGMIWSRDNMWLEISFASGALQLRTYDTGWNAYTLIDDVPANEWHQIIVTYDVNANTWGSYLNGQFVKSITAAEPDHKKINRIGSAASSFYDGEFANAKIFDVELTAAQVADLYNNPEKVVPTGVADSALKLWLPMQEGAGTTAYNGAPDALGSELVTNGDFATDSNWTKGTGWTISGGTASCDGSQSGNTDLSQNITTDASKQYKITYTISNYSAGSIFIRLNSGNVTSTKSSNGTFTEILVGAGGTQVTLRGNSTFVGSIDNVSVKEISNNGTISGATWTHGIGAPVAQTAVINWNKHTLDGTNAVLIPQGLTSGRDLLGNLFENVRKQGALNLDGNSWAEVHDNASLDLTTAVTLEAWVYWTGSNSSKGILGRWFSGVASYMFYASTSTQLLFFINTSNSPVNISGTGWKHIVGTYDSTNRRVYIDGQEIGSGTGYTSPIAVGDKPIEIGRYAGNTAYEYDGEIAQPRIYNRALTAEEVQRNYDAGKNTYTN